MQVSQFETRSSYINIFLFGLGLKLIQVVWWVFLQQCQDCFSFQVFIYTERIYVSDDSSPLVQISILPDYH